MRDHCDPTCEWNDGTEACCTPSPWEAELIAERDRYRTLLADLRDYIAKPEGDGPFRLCTALERIDQALATNQDHVRGGS